MSNTFCPSPIIIVTVCVISDIHSSIDQRQDQTNKSNGGKLSNTIGYLFHNFKPLAWLDGIHSLSDWRGIRIIGTEDLEVGKYINRRKPWLINNHFVHHLCAVLCLYRDLFTLFVFPILNSKASFKFANNAFSNRGSTPKLDISERFMLKNY